MKWITLEINIINYGKEGLVSTMVHDDGNNYWYLG